MLVNVNALRERHGLRTLKSSAVLAEAAAAHSREMAERGFFAHESADGTPYWMRIQRFYGAAGSRRSVFGENLVWASPALSARDVVSLWMRSPKHRANLLRKAWRKIGIAAVHANGAPGVYEGRAVTILTAYFSRRSS